MTRIVYWIFAYIVLVPVKAIADEEAQDAGCGVRRHSRVVVDGYIQCEVDNDCKWRNCKICMVWFRYPDLYSVCRRRVSQVL